MPSPLHLGTPASTNDRSKSSADSLPVAELQQNDLMNTENHQRESTSKLLSPRRVDLHMQPGWTTYMMRDIEGENGKRYPRNARKLMLSRKTYMPSLWFASVFLLLKTSTNGQLVWKQNHAIAWNIILPFHCQQESLPVGIRPHVAVLHTLENEYTHRTAQISPFKWE